MVGELSVDVETPAGLELFVFVVDESADGKFEVTVVVFLIRDKVMALQAPLLTTLIDR